MPVIRYFYITLVSTDIMANHFSELVKLKLREREPRLKEVTPGVTQQPSAVSTQ